MLQAAVILTMLQLDAPSHQARHRARSERLPNMIRALRALGLTNSDGDGRNPSFVAGNTGYALDITENVARLVYCTYIVDCKLAVFYRASPHLNVGEMTVKMPLNRHTSIVAEPASFGTNASKTDTMSLATCIRIILHASEDEWNLQDFVGLSMFDLFVIICAIHSIISTTRASLTLINSTHGIETGLRRWRSIWDANLNVFTEENSTRSFMACAPEIWYLTKIALYHGTYEKLWSISGGTTDTEDMTIFHKVLVALGYTQGAKQ
ncbi:hypothetical protein C7974DRAFT_120441 [Boeremia exigua]|uniref:uncharacterized protein n=1 Tax=Boeremia exigua TaxID=749465 RepID=UPI001E8E73DA|nr:uncharacterized protein C7974DRAFT_120441 [Boeremia exigua]KAH6638726.1 hypothetical protein C7974DRAFT_120441 [Boeremia exigua]